MADDRETEVLRVRNLAKAARDLQVNDDEFIRTFREMNPEMQRVCEEALMLDHSDGVGQGYHSKEKIEERRSRLAALIERARA